MPNLTRRAFLTGATATQGTMDLARAAGFDVDDRGRV